jgi:nanoRNase/pAp phosphatase (c-di-AMP/oligoRNAs hydrolase)
MAAQWLTPLWSSAASSASASATGAEPGSPPEGESHLWRVDTPIAGDRIRKTLAGTSRASARVASTRKMGSMSVGGTGRGRELLAALEPADRVLILPHENPDPDALASAAGLQAVIQHGLGTPVIIARSGRIGRPENRALALALRVQLERADRVLPGFRGSLILVDTQPGRGNNALPRGVKPLAVIDHHPDWGENDRVAFVDLRPDYGATSTIVTEYIQELEVPLGARLATALFYGIASETRHLGRETQSFDIIASQFLYPFVDKRLLGAIEVPRLSAGYFRLITEAIQNAILCDDVALTLLDRMPYPDAVGEAADLLVRLEDVSWAVCVGYSEESVHVSVRSNETDATAGQLLASILPSGSAGGHGMIAGGRTALGDRAWAAAACELIREILRELGRGGQVRLEPLLSAGSAPGTEGEAAAQLMAELRLAAEAGGPAGKRR